MGESFLLHRIIKTLKYFMYYTDNNSIIYCLTNAFSEAEQATAEV